MRAVEDHYWWYGALRQHVAEAIDPRFASGKILDAGCGTGGMLRGLRDRFPDAQLFGVDESERALQLTAARNLRAQLVRSSVESLPFADSEFDCVLSLDVWSAATVNAERAANETARVLHRGGKLILNLAAFDFLKGEHDVAVDVNRRFTRGEVRALLSRAGFTVERATYWNAGLLPPVAVARWLSRNGNRSQARSDFRPLPKALNAALREIALLELRTSRYVSLPFGTSVFATARRQ